MSNSPLPPELRVDPLSQHDVGLWGHDVVAEGRDEHDGSHGLAGQREDAHGRGRGEAVGPLPKPAENAAVLLILLDGEHHQVLEKNAELVTSFRQKSKEVAPSVEKI